MIGIVGATGAVGRVAVRRLGTLRSEPLRLGGRDGTRLRALAGEVPGATATRVDVTDPELLAAFCAGCHVVVNCAGPSYQVLGTVARAALAAGAHYVDAAGDRVALHDLDGDAEGPSRQRCVIFSAGLMPGLSGLLPRLLVDDEDVPPCLAVYAGGAVPLTRVSAIDAMLTRGPRFGTPFAVWRDGAVVERTLEPVRGARLPGFDGPVDAIPFLSVEAAALGATLRLPELRGYAVYISTNLPDALAMSWADEETDVEDHAVAVIAAAAADVAEVDPHYVLLARTEPTDDGRLGQLRLRTPDPYGLSGVVAALAADAVLGGRIPAGRHLAADVLDAQAVTAALATDPLVTALHVQPWRNSCG